MSFARSARPHLGGLTAALMALLLVAIASSTIVMAASDCASTIQLTGISGDYQFSGSDTSCE